LESEFDFCARRAAEEFLAAGRANCDTKRRTHRQLAERYAEVVRELIATGASAAPASGPASKREPAEAERVR